MTEIKTGSSLNISGCEDEFDGIMIGIGWKQRKSGLLSRLGRNKSLDIDVSALMLSASGKLKSKEDIIYFGNRSDAALSVVHFGDKKEGISPDCELEDLERIAVYPYKISPRIDRVLFTVNIYDCIPRRQDFSMVDEAYIRAVEMGTGNEILRYRLTEDYSRMTSLEAAELTRFQDGWKFTALGRAGRDGSLAELISRFM